MIAHAAAPSSHQLELARCLGLDPEPGQSVESLVPAIEARLGDGKTGEQARWFLLSVWRQLDTTSSEALEQIDLASVIPDSVVERFLGIERNRVSLDKVLRDPCCRYTLVRFAGSRQPSRHQLADSTTAFTQARGLLLDWQDSASAESGEQCERNERDQLTGQSAREGQSEETESGQARTERSIVSRRAARRGFAGNAARVTGASREAAGQPEPGAVMDSAMTEQEYRELEQVLASEQTSGQGQRWRYPQLVDRLSLAGGLAAGGLAFLLIYWLFLR